ncbi:MAG: exosortase H [Halobacteriota archaeon]
MSVQAKGKVRNAQRKKRVAQNTEGNGKSHANLLTAVLEKAKENEEAIKYVARFLALCFAFYIVYYIIIVSDTMVMANMRHVTTTILGAIFSLAGLKVVERADVLSINGFSMEIIDECTAVFSAIVYCSCVLAYPATLKQKSLGILFGVPSLYAINILRIFLLALVGMRNPDMFKFMHVYLWQASFIIFVVVLFLIWLKMGVTDGEG